MKAFTFNIFTVTAGMKLILSRYNTNTLITGQITTVITNNPNLWPMSPLTKRTKTADIQYLKESLKLKED